MKKVIATYGQSIIDIAIQEYGCIEGLLPFCQDNNLGLSDDLTIGAEYLIRDEVPQLTANNVAIAAHYAANKIKVNSGWVYETIGQFLPSDFDDDFVNN